MISNRCRKCGGAAALMRVTPLSGDDTRILVVLRCFRCGHEFQVTAPA